MLSRRNLANQSVVIVCWIRVRGHHLVTMRNRGSLPLCLGLFVRVVLPGFCRKKACMSTLAVFSLSDMCWSTCPLYLPCFGRPLIEMCWVFECFCTSVLLFPVAWKSVVEGFWVALAPYVPTWLGRPLSMVIGGRGVETLTVVWDVVPDPY